MNWQPQPGEHGFAVRFYPGEGDPQCEQVFQDPITAHAQALVAAAQYGRHGPVYLIPFTRRPLWTEYFPKQATRY